MRIRKATTRDWSDIQLLIRKHPDTLMQDDLPQPHEFSLARNARGTIVACAALCIYSHRLAEVRCVIAEGNDKRLPSRLIRALVDEARRKKVCMLITTTSDRPLFEKEGFRSFKREQFALFKPLTTEMHNV